MNIWVSAVFPPHPAHLQAQQVLRAATLAEPAVFCRSTQLNFMRLASSPTLLKAYGAEGFTNFDALLAFDALVALPQVCEREEPPGTVRVWRDLAGRDTASPKVWMDAYLAAFAMVSGLRLTTLDRDFQAFEPQGLDLVLLTAETATP